MKYVKIIIATLLLTVLILYISNIERGIMSFVLHPLIASQFTIVFWESYKANKKKESILNAIIALMFWIIVFIKI